MADDERLALERALHGLDFPAPRNKLVSVAIANGAGPDVIERLRQLPETADYRNEADLRDALGVTIPGARPDGGWE